MFNKTVERFEFLFKRFGTGSSSMELQVRYSVARFAYAMKEKINIPKELCSASAALRSHAITTSHRKQFIENLALSPQRKNIVCKIILKTLYNVYIFIEPRMFLKSL